MASVHKPQGWRLAGEIGNVSRHICFADNVSRDDHRVSNAVRSSLDSVGGDTHQSAAEFFLWKHTGNEHIWNRNRFHDNQIPVHEKPLPQGVPSPKGNGTNKQKLIANHVSAPVRRLSEARAG